MVRSVKRSQARFAVRSSRYLGDRVRGLGLIQIAMSALVIGVMAVAPAGAVSIELKDVASDRVERQRAAAEGNLPLPGTPDLSKLSERLADKGVKLGSPILLRVFKSESEFEVWFRKDDQYVLFATYPVCHWSGTLGPKLREGDKQTPEGFYTVTRGQIRHMGRWPRSLNLGFPNAFDKVQARSGSHILVHGGCSSVGCFAMTNSVIEEIYAFTEAAINGGQVHVPVHVFPFRLSEANLTSQKDSPWFPFWQNLKEGHDFVDRVKRAPRVSVCDNRYKFSDPAPEEGAVSGPLAQCGDTRAALEALEQLSPLAHAQLSSQMNPFVPSPRSLNPNANPNPRQKSSPSQNLVDRDGARSPLSRFNTSRQSPAKGLSAALQSAAPPSSESRTRSLIPPPPCSMELASCRKFVALRDAAAERRMAKAPSRKRQTAQR
jgi:murein L,D-transpeptidase YafK